MDFGFIKNCDTLPNAFIMDGPQLIGVADENGNMLFWNMYGQELYGRHLSGGSNMYYLQDHLGSTRRVIDQSGIDVDYYDYYPFGLVMRSQIGGDGTTETFTGKKLDDETGYYYFGSRYYDPGLGNWHSTDPAGQFYSPYVYAGNNPVMYVDPDGEFAIIIAGALIGAYAGASIQSGTANFTNWKRDAWKGAIIGAFVGAAGGAMIGSSLGVASASTKAYGVVATIANNASLNMGVGAVFGADTDELWKHGVVGAVTAGYSVSGGGGLVEAFGSESKAWQFAGRLAYQSSSTAMSSVGNNWASGQPLFSRVTVGVGPVNLTLGKDQKLLQWQNNLGNIFFNTLGMANHKHWGGNREFDWEHLTFKYSGGGLGDLWGKYADATGAHTLIGATLGKLDDWYNHELNHMWLSRSLNDRFLPHYLLHGLHAKLRGENFWRHGFFENIADDWEF